jgi:hypothetical protein
MGLWRAINLGVTGSMTVTSGASDGQARVVRGPDLSDSQADSAGSIPVTRSNEKSHVRALLERRSLDDFAPTEAIEELGRCRGRRHVEFCA